MRYATFFILMASLLQMSCAVSTTFTREPAGGEETLVIGRVLFYNQLTRTGSVPIGKFRRDVVLEFEDVDTGRKLKAKAVDARGFFFLHNPTASRLRLVRYSYHSGVSQPELHPDPRKKKKKTSIWSDKGATAAMIPKVKRVYAIEAGKVNNLGYLEWIGNMQNRSHRVTFNQEYEETRDSFADRYPESLWIERAWVSVRGE